MTSCTDPYNYLRMVDYCKRHIAPERLLGFMQTVWYPTLNTQRARHLDAIAKVRVGMDCWNGKIRNVNVENPRTPLDIPDKPGIRVGVYGSGIGDLGILEALAGAKDLNAFSLPRLDRKSLSQTEVLVIPVPSSQAFYSSAKNLLCRWVAGGGRIMLLHSAVGYRHFSPLFPKLAKALTHPRSQTVHVVARHPVTAGLSIGEKFDHSYKDHVAMKPGAGARVLVKDEQGYGVVIAGKAGRGKVLLNGMITGYASVGPVELDQAPQGGERDVLINGIRWLGSH